MIISVLLQFLDKINRQDLKPAVWKGAFTGLFVAIAVGVGFIIAFYETGKAAFKGNTEYIVEAVLVNTCMNYNSCRCFCNSALCGTLRSLSIRTILLRLFVVRVGIHEMAPYRP